MQRLFLFTVLCIFIFNLASAQEYPAPFEYSRNSCPAEFTFFNFDITDSTYVDTMAVHRIIFRNQDATVWNSSPAGLLYQTCTTFTYAGSTNYQPPSGIMEWYFHSENDTAVVTQSPENTGDTFPVPDHLMADLGSDPTGDVDNGGGNHLDIVHAYGSYSDSRLYFSLENAGGGFPTSGGFLTYYIYSVGLLNPDATDSIAYVLLYADAVIYTTGLYALDPADSSLTQIGSVNTSISGNTLHMSCSISDLTAQPGWPLWPPENGFVGAAPVTATLQLDDLVTNDMGKSAVFVPSSNLLDFNASNTAPVLSTPSVTSDQTGLVTADIIYTDSDNHLPVTRSLVFDSVPYELFACEKGYATGAGFYTELNVAESGWYHYSFEFSDGCGEVNTPLDSIYVDLSPFLCGDVNSDGKVDILDIIYLIDYKFNEGPAPVNENAADVNSDGKVDILDIIYLIDYKFNEGPEPDCP